MKHEQIEEINKTIAESQGYEFRDESSRYPDEEAWQKYMAVYAPCGGFVGLSKPDWSQIPDYWGNFKDGRLLLSVIYKSGDVQLIELFKKHIREITLRDGPDGMDLVDRLLWHESHHISEAFLRTFNLWKEEWK